MKLDFEDLFAQAFNALIDHNGGSIEAALDDLGVQDERDRAPIKSWFGWDEEFAVKVYDIDYCIDLEDLESNGFDTEKMSDEEIEAAIKTIKDTLPDELELEVECTEEDLEDAVCDAISDETGWLTNSFKFKKI